MMRQLQKGNPDIGRKDIAIVLQKDGTLVRYSVRRTLLQE